MPLKVLRGFYGGPTIEGKMFYEPTIHGRTSKRWATQRN